MKGDFTRFTYDRDRNYTRVLKQQGRVDLDADWNEQAEMVEALREELGRDVLGDRAALAPGIVRESDAFRVEVDAGEIVLGAGRLYVDGIPCVLGERTAFTDQPVPPAAATAPGAPGARDFFYLDVWRREVTWLEDAELREVALGGPDTTVRVRTQWEVKARRLQAGEDCAEALASVRDERATDATLVVDAQEVPDAADPCLIRPKGSYRGLENRLYRVEIHEDSDGAPVRFKWSRDNGSVVFKIEELATAKQLKLKRLGRDEVITLHIGDRVELLDLEQVARGESGRMRNIAGVDPATRTVTLTDDHGLSGDGPFILRRWDQRGANVVEAPIGERVDLEDGIQVEFHGTRFRAGDYWVFTARTADGSVHLARPEPHGVEHHFCPLAIVEWTSSTAANVVDCRSLYPTLTELRGFFLLGGGNQLIDPAETTLPAQLRVGVAHDRWPVQGARVRFSVESGGGTLGGGGASEVIVETNANGVARVNWRPGPAAADQTVLAEYLEADADTRLHLPIRFHAHHVNAAQVSYDAKNCDYQQRAGTKDVQAALDRLCPPVRLVLLGGDGQTGCVGKTLRHKLRVGVFQGRDARTDLKVDFEVTDGKGTLTGGGTGRPVDDQGVADCSWTLGQDPKQRVVATISDGSIKTPPIVFNAHLTNAECVYLNEGVCGDHTTVEEALRDLCGRQGGGCSVVVPPGEGTIEKTILTLFEQAQGKTVDLCLCLVPGVYSLSNELVLDGKKPQDGKRCGRIKITGCAGTTVLLTAPDQAPGRLRFANLQGVTLRDVEFRRDEERAPGHLVIVEGCGEVSFETCRFEGLVGTSHALIGVRTTGRVHIEGCSLLARSPDVQKFDDVFVGDAVEIRDLIRLPDEREFRRAAKVFVGDFAARDRDRRNRVAIVMSDARTRDFPASDAQLFRAAVTNFGAATPNARAITDVLGLLRARRTELETGNAIALGDAEGDTSLIGNRIEGDVVYVGVEPSVEGEMTVDPVKPFDVEEGRRIRSIFSEVMRLRATNSLRIRDNRLGRFTISQSLRDKFNEFGNDVSFPGFRDLFVSNNVVVSDRNTLMAAFLSFTANDFRCEPLKTAQVAALLLGEEATATGNRAAPKDPALTFLVPRSFAGAANLSMNIVA